MTPRLAARGATRKNRAPKNASIRSAIRWGSGIRRISGPELWNIFNSRINKGESIRVFPLSNWTELDVWLYIHMENIPIVPLYFAKERDVVVRNGSIVVIHAENEAAARRKDTDAEVPDALARMRAVHGRDPVRGRYACPRLSRRCFRSGGRSAKTAPSITMKKDRWRSRREKGYFW